MAAGAGELVFVNAGLLLYILRFPVYTKEGGYNNFTSAHSWPVITLSIWKACLLSDNPPTHPGVQVPPPHTHTPHLILHLATSGFESETLDDAYSEGGVSALTPQHC